MRNSTLEECIKEYNYLLDESMKLIKRAGLMRKYARKLYDVDIAHYRTVN